MLTTGSEESKAQVLANLDDPVPELIAFQKKAGTPEARTLAFEAVEWRRAASWMPCTTGGQSLRENADPSIRDRFHQRQAMVECEASITIALGYRDLRPAMIGSCALTGTELSGRYERVVHDLRSGWTDQRSKDALRAVGVLRRKVEELDAGLSRDLPQLSAILKPARLSVFAHHLQTGEVVVAFVAYESRYGAFILSHSGFAVDRSRAGEGDRSSGAGFVRRSQRLECFTGGRREEGRRGGGRHGTRCPGIVVDEVIASDRRCFQHRGCAADCVSRRTAC
ncbi:MAG: hypothetical protein WDO73_32215 [Ignavibacteriota bacterium]